MSFARLALLTTAAMLAFAGNSLLCRWALRDTGIDPASFAVIRLASGAVVLALLVRPATFSFAYVALSARPPR